MSVVFAQAWPSRSVTVWKSSGCCLEVDDGGKVPELVRRHVDAYLLRR